MAELRTERIPLVIHVGQVADHAELAEWWNPSDGEIETRTVKFYGDKGIWLGRDELPEALSQHGGRITKVVGVTHYEGLNSPSVSAGHRVLLQPEPTNPYNPNAIAVFTEDNRQIGYLPKEVAAETMAESRRRGTGYSAFVVTEHRSAATKERVGIAVLIGPGAVWAEQQST